MQTDSFLGGISKEGFVSNFLCAQQQAGRYGFFLKGGPGTGKSTMMKTIAAAFPDEIRSLYHCASDPVSLDAVVFEKSGIFLVDATAPHEMNPSLPYVTGQIVDCASALDPKALEPHRATIQTLAADNAAAHLQARQVLRGVASMQEMLADIGTAALLPEKLSGFAERFAKRILPRKQSSRKGKIHVRQRTSFTPSGLHTFLPDAHTIYTLHDPYHTAAPRWLSHFVEHACARGLDCEITTCLTHNPPSILHCSIPAERLTILTPAAWQAPLTKDATALSLQRFYHPATLRQQRTLARFCEKMEATFASQVVGCLAEALRIHDALETYYSAALQLDLLQALTEQLHADILHRMETQGKQSTK